MMITSHADLGTVRRAIDLGAVDYLMKPYKEEVLLNRVQRIIGNSKTSPEGLTLQEVKKDVRREIKRAERGEDHFSLMLLRTPLDNNDMTSLEFLKEQVLTIIRETDTCLITSEKSLLLLLPITDREGAKVVKEKLIEGFLEKTVSFEFISTAIAVFPEDGKDENELLRSLTS